MSVFHNHFLSLVLAFILLCACASFVRFMVAHDYLVMYEGECDPTTMDCFVGCANEDCSENYYYMHVQKYAPDLLKQCGKHIENCEEASTCSPELGERECSITYCDPAVDGVSCDDLTEENSVLDSEAATTI